jgi:hypothetical protein
MEPDFLMMMLHGFLHGVGFVLALLLMPLFLGHPWIAIVIVLAIIARWRRS